jgi:hypothetical protein
MEDGIHEVVNIEKALHNPNGITDNSYKPYLVLIVVFSTSSSIMRI